MPDPDLILTLTGGLAAALVLGYLMHRLKVSPIAGYLLAGYVVGPYSPGIVVNHHLATQLADIGVILLMFGVGLHFDLKTLSGIMRRVVPGSLSQSLVTTLLGALTAMAFGLGMKAGLLYGLTLSVASTVAAVRVFSDAQRLHSPVGNRATAWLVVEDFFMVFVLILAPAVLGLGQHTGVDVVRDISVTIVKLASVILGTFLLGGRIVPWILMRVAATRSRELFTLCVLVSALGLAVGASTLFGISMALGALMAGMVVGRSEFSLRAATEALPMRDAFAVLFFVSIGMLFNPVGLLAAPSFFLATLALVLVGKPLVAGAVLILTGCSSRTTLILALALAQIGEFSFILAGVGGRLGLLEESTRNLLVAASIVSLILNPFYLKLAGVLETWLVRHPFLWRRLNRESEPVVDRDEDQGAGADRRRAVIVGYGPVGRTLGELLLEHGIEPTVIEMNHETVRRLKAKAVPALYGDASHGDVLRAAGAHRAGTLILSAPGIPTAADIIRQAREMNPGIRILVNTSFLGDGPALEAAGADIVLSGEEEVASAMCASVLRMMEADASFRFAGSVPPETGRGKG